MKLSFSERVDNLAAQVAAAECADDIRSATAVGVRLHNELNGVLLTALRSPEGNTAGYDSVDLRLTGILDSIIPVEPVVETPAA